MAMATAPGRNSATFLGINRAAAARSKPPMAGQALMQFRNAFRGAAGGAVGSRPSPGSFIPQLRNINRTVSQRQQMTPVLAALQKRLGTKFPGQSAPGAPFGRTLANTLAGRRLGISLKSRS